LALLVITTSGSSCREALDFTIATHCSVAEFVTDLHADHARIAVVRSAEGVAVIELCVGLVVKSPAKLSVNLPGLVPVKSPKGQAVVQLHPKIGYI
jgi:hypothetical protein